MPQSSEVWAEVFVELLPTEQGGRKRPLNLSNDSPAQYRPHFRVVGGSGEMLGVVFMDGPDEALLPGESINATVKLLYPGVSYDELDRAKESGQNHATNACAVSVHRKEEQPNG